MILQMRATVKREQLRRLLPVFLQQNADHVDRHRVDFKCPFYRFTEFFERMLFEQS